MNHSFQPNQYSMFPPEEHRLRFAIHLHHATQTHYDLRLEVSGWAQSWVIRLGPSLDPNVEREIIRVNDHGLKCLETEGRIPDGNYGAGPLIMWDRGTYAPISEEKTQELAIEQGLEKGCLRLRFDGKKLCGDWMLTRKRRKWVFVKLLDAYASTEDVLLLDQSVLSGRRITDL